MPAMSRDTAVAEVRALLDGADDDTLIELPAGLLRAVLEERDAQRDLLGAIWLYVSWYSVTRQLTTEQREMWSDAVDAFAGPGAVGPGEPLPVVAVRWWRDDFGCKPKAATAPQSAPQDPARPAPSETGSAPASGPHSPRAGATTDEA